VGSLSVGWPVARRFDYARVARSVNPRDRRRAWVIAASWPAPPARRRSDPLPGGSAR